MRDDRQPWETRGGATTGEDVPITSEPRAEIAPGVPRPPRPTDEARRRRAAEAPDSRNGAGDDVEGRDATEEREVRAADPELSPETNARLTEELREVVGSEHVRVAADRPRASHGEVPQKGGASVYLNQHRLQLIRTSAIMLTFGAIVSLATGDWWLLPLAAGVHALGTMAVVLTIVRMTTITEHPSPDVAAALAEEGVSSPDERFSQMVQEFAQRPGRGAGEVISPGFNERETPAQADTATASTEQSSAMTPTGDPTGVGGQGGAPDLIIWVTAFSLFVLSIVLPAVMGGGWLWLLTAVMVPLLVGWVVMQRLMITGEGQLRIRGRGPMVAIVLCTAVAVAVFCAVVALAFQH